MESSAGGEACRQDLLFFAEETGKVPAGMEIKKGEDNMRKYKGNGELETVICNGCGKKLVVGQGVLREGALEVCHAWDYFSEKDGEIHRFDLCEECYDRLVSELRIPPEVEEQVEFV